MLLIEMSPAKSISTHCFCSVSGFKSRVTPVYARVAPEVYPLQAITEEYRDLCSSDHSPYLHMFNASATSQHSAHASSTRRTPTRASLAHRKRPSRSRRFSPVPIPTPATWTAPVHLDLSSLNHAAIPPSTQDVLHIALSAPGKSALDPGQALGLRPEALGILENLRSGRSGSNSTVWPGHPYISACLR